MLPLSFYPASCRAKAKGTGGETNMAADHTPLQVIITQRGAHERGVKFPSAGHDMIPHCRSHHRLRVSCPPVAAQSPDLASLAMPADVPPSPIPPLIP